MNDDKARRVMGIMQQMSSTGAVAADMSDDELITHLSSMGNGDLRSLDEAVIGEVVHRWLHPWKYRWERITKCLRR